MLNLVSLSDQDFDKLSRFIQKEYGIKLPPVKKTMVESRLQKRLRVLNIGSFKEYCEYVFSEEGAGEEMVYMINAITTNKTDFFREPGHFEYLKEKVIPFFINTFGIGVREPLRIWSAGCSTGEEPYTLGIILTEYKKNYPDFQFHISASDIATDVLDKAKTAIYAEEKIENLPVSLRTAYFFKSKDRSKREVRVKPEIRNLVHFSRINLMNSSFRKPVKDHVIFCRNVMIYFERGIQEKLIQKFYNQLTESGYLFLGHSETLCSMKVSFRIVAPTVYKKIS